jgi:hypothetical protein
MRTIEALVVTLLDMSLLVAGVLYVVEVLIAYFRPGPRQRPEIDPSQAFRSGSRWFIWAGVMSLDFLVMLSRPMVNILSEASADVGEWAIARHQSRISTHLRGQ